MAQQSSTKPDPQAELKAYLARLAAQGQQGGGGRAGSVGVSTDAFVPSDMMSPLTMFDMGSISNAGFDPAGSKALTTQIGKSNRDALAFQSNLATQQALAPIREKAAQDRATAEFMALLERRTGNMKGGSGIGNKQILKSETGPKYKRPSTAMLNQMSKKQAAREEEEFEADLERRREIAKMEQELKLALSREQQRDRLAEIKAQGAEALKQIAAQKQLSADEKLSQIVSLFRV